MREREKKREINMSMFYTHNNMLAYVFMYLAGKPLNSIFVSPAVTPIKSVLEPYSNNPAFRMCFYDPSDFFVLVGTVEEGSYIHTGAKFLGGARGMCPHQFFSAASSFANEVKAGSFTRWLAQS